jgi:hypothetical protein
MLIIFISIIGSFAAPTLGEQAVKVSGWINLAVALIWVYGYVRADCAYDIHGNYIKI